MADPAIQAMGLTKWFGECEARTVAVAGVSFEAYFGEVLYLVGPSGSGADAGRECGGAHGRGRPRGHRAPSA